MQERGVFIHVIVRRRNFGVELPDLDYEQRHCTIYVHRLTKHVGDDQHRYSRDHLKQ